MNKPNTSRPLPDVAAGWNSLRSLAAGLAAPGAAYPCELEGFQGSSLAFFAAELLRAQSRDLAFIVAGCVDHRLYRLPVFGRRGEQARVAGFDQAHMQGARDRRPAAGE
ncbi:hypothetical protein, partial [Treponema endosymbiont of Eucomonympha sp.]|uniref:hypothetical protein n=1 Tax=Treponema endosymbiont of Eucomonympha sp. TaxID=1580831 RepID=UPI000AE540B5